MEQRESKRGELNPLFWPVFTWSCREETEVRVVSSSRVCLGFSSVVVVGLKLSWSDESVAIVWENRRLHKNGTSDRLLLSHLSFGFWFWERGVMGFSPSSLKRVAIFGISRSRSQSQSLCVLGSSMRLISFFFLRVPLFLSFLFCFKQLVSFYTKRL